MKLRPFAEGAGAAAVVLLVVIGLLNSWSAEAWGALAAWITAAVAVLAGYVAVHQLGEARQMRHEQARLRREEAQPYVVAYMEFSQASTYFVDLVVKNFRATAAYDVRLDIDPFRAGASTRTPTTRSRPTPRNRPMLTSTENVWLPDYIPVLAPGQDWRTLWDSGRRSDTDLPDRHAGKITYRDSQGETYTTEAVLDWRFVKGRQTLTVYRAHDAARALREMSKVVAKWKEGATGGLRVYVRDGDARDERTREFLEARRAERQARETTENDDPEPST